MWQAYKAILWLFLFASRATKRGRFSRKCFSKSQNRKQNAESVLALVYQIGRNVNKRGQKALKAAQKVEAEG